MPSRSHDTQYSTHLAENHEWEEILSGLTPNIIGTEDPVETINALFADDLAAVDAMLADLDGEPAATEALTEDEIAAVELIEAAPKLDPERLEKLKALFKNDRARKEAKAKERALRDAERHLEWQKEHQRELGCERKRKQRTKERAAVAKSTEEILKELEAAPCPYPTPWRSHRPYKKRLRALCTATASPSADSFMVQMRGRELDITDAWVIVQRARKKHGPKASLKQIADHHPDQGMSKDRIRNFLRNVAKLEAIGGPWHGL